VWVALWLLSVAAAAGAGWLFGSLAPRPDDHAVATQGPREPGVWPGFGPLIAEADGIVEATPPPPVEPEPTPDVPPAEPPAPPPEPVEPEPVEPEPVVETVDEIVEAVEPEPPDPTPASAGILLRALQASRAAEEDDTATARDEARLLLQDFPSYSALSAALREDGAGEAQAPLTAMRMLQLAGLEDISRDVARELLRSYGATERVAESIRRWKVLGPYIDSVGSSIADGRWVTVTGTVSNPDVVTVRRLRVRVDALDAARNRLDSVEVRVRPKVLGPGEQGTFVVEFRNVDPASVLRTLARITSWESEVPQN
jgi:hypothetical protein